MFDYEKKAQSEGFSFVIGIDEAGRGPLAGPVVASAVLLRDNNFSSVIKDSKKMTEKQRNCAFVEVFDKALVGVGIISSSVIDTVNILEATFLAMNRAVRQLVLQIPDSQREDFNRKVCLLIDGNMFKSELPYAYRTIVKGDSAVLSIACASIVAKVTRDRILASYDKIYPEYGFKQHKGYGTVKHKDAIREYGQTLIHRKSFKF
jgi:ribonuclease HII